MFCKHNYVYTQGHFYCTKCGQRSYGQVTRRKQGKFFFVIITLFIIVGITAWLFSDEFLEFNAENFAKNTSTILRETINEQSQKFQIAPNNISVDDIAEIPRKIQESNPINKKPAIDKFELEKQIHLLTNQHRTQNGLATLSFDENLSKVARNHSKDMAARNYFSHETPEGAEPTNRAVTQGYKCEKIVGNLIYSGIGENIFQNNLYDTVWYSGGIAFSYEWNTQEEIAQSTVDGWMESPGHRENILTKLYDREGIGVEISSDDKVYITQNFC